MSGGYRTNILGLGPSRFTFGGGLFREQFVQGNEWDLSNVAVVLPGNRAGRRLREILAWRAQNRAHPVLLQQPRILTPHGIADLLCSTAPADGLLSVMVLVRVLRENQALDALFPHPPDGDDLPGWMRLAGEIEGLFDELDGEVVTCAEVAACCARLAFGVGSRNGIHCTLSGSSGKLCLLW